MANTTISPNMSLVIPTAGVDPGPDWANNLNADLSILDGHDHSSGKGVQISPTGMNINSALSFGNNQATNLQAVVFTPQASFPTSNSLYNVSGDFYIRNGSGTQVQITSGNSLAVAGSSLTNPPAIASFISSVLVVNSNTNTPANIQGGSILLGNNTAGSNFLTLSPPAAMAASYGLTLPNTPPAGATYIVGLNSTGAFSTPGVFPVVTAGIASQAVAQANLAARSTGTTVGAGGVAVSTSTSNFNTSNAGFVTFASVTITTTGRPVMIALQGDGLNIAFIQVSSTTFLSSASIQILRGASSLNVYTIGSSTSSGTTSETLPPSTITMLDFPTAGTYTYTMKGQTPAPADTLFVSNCVMTAYEI